jgi:ABC-2 type transport system ATP-binding protein
LKDKSVKEVPDMRLLEIEHVTKIYGKGLRVNDDITVAVESGEVFGLLGPNGAGKTTLVSQVIGLVAPTSGTIQIDGVDVIANPGYARQACSYQPQSQVPVEGVTVRQAIELVGRIRGVPSKEVRARSDQLIQALEIEEWANQGGERLSGGVKRLTAFCMAAVAPGKLVILDEPTNDIDPLRRRLLWQQVRRLSDQGSAVLLVTHNVLEAERSVDRLAIIDQGKLIASGTAASLKGHENGYFRLEITLEPSVAEPEIPVFLSNSVVIGRRMIGRVETADVEMALKWAQHQKKNGRIEEYSIGPATLEDVYIRMVGRQDVLDEPAEEVNHGLLAEVV